MWCSREPDELPCRKLAPLQPGIFAAYSGPADGLCYVQKLKQQQTSPRPRGKKGPVCGSDTWIKKNRKAYGIATSLYDQHPISKKISGDPIADAFALCARTNNSVLVMADGVNWGEKSMLAARCAVHGAVDYIHDQLFAANTQPLKTTHDAFHLLLKSLEAAHACILAHEGGLTTLCVALILPTRARAEFAVCVANVGDSLAYVYSKAKGVREITIGSHDISSERDIRDAGGALGPVSGSNPELHNLTCSLTYVQAGDIVFLTTDGISDNYDPVVTKIAASTQPKPKPTRPSPNDENPQPNDTGSETSNPVNKSSEPVNDSSQSTSQNNQNSMQSTIESKSMVSGSTPSPDSSNDNTAVDSNEAGISNQTIRENCNDSKGIRTNNENDIKCDTQIAENIERKDETTSISSQKNVENRENHNSGVSSSAGQIATSPANDEAIHTVNANDASPTDNVSSVKPVKFNKNQPSSTDIVLSDQSAPVSPNEDSRTDIRSSSQRIDNKGYNTAHVKDSSPNEELIQPVTTQQSILRNKPQKRSFEAESHFDKTHDEEKSKTKENRRNKSKSLPVKMHWKRRNEARLEEKKSKKAGEPIERSFITEAPTLALRAPGLPEVASNKSNNPEVELKQPEMESERPATESERPEAEIGMKDGRPLMAPLERHQYACRQMERVLLEYELMTEDCICAQELCGALLHHVLTLTHEKRTVLEDPSLYGRKLKPSQRKERDAAIVSRMARAPGKLDHASIVAYEVGMFKGDQDENYEITSARDVYGSQEDIESRGSEESSGDNENEDSSVEPSVSKSRDVAYDVNSRDDAKSHGEPPKLKSRAESHDVQSRAESRDVQSRDEPGDKQSHDEASRDESCLETDNQTHGVENAPAPNPMAISLDIPFIDDSEDSEREQ